MATSIDHRDIVGDPQTRGLCLCGRQHSLRFFKRYGLVCSWHVILDSGDTRSDRNHAFRFGAVPGICNDVENDHSASNDVPLAKHLEAVVDVLKPDSLCRMLNLSLLRQCQHFLQVEVVCPE